MTVRPVILLTNDDRVHARGLPALHTAAAAALGQVIVVARPREQSLDDDR